MNRRNFFVTGLISGVSLTTIHGALANPAVTDMKPESCSPNLDYVTAEATGFTRYEHFHILAIPISILINPPAEGYRVRTSNLDQDSLDLKAFTEFIKETGIDFNALKNHSHDVKFTQDELNRIAGGEKEVKITVLTPKGNLAHHFFFTASRSAIVKVQKGRGAR